MYEDWDIHLHSTNPSIIAESLDVACKMFFFYQIISFNFIRFTKPGAKYIMTGAGGDVNSTVVWHRLSTGGDDVRCFWGAIASEPNERCVSFSYPDAGGVALIVSMKFFGRNVFN